MHTLDADKIRVCPLKPRRLPASMEIDAEAVLRCNIQRLLHEAHHLGVISLHEVYLETFHAALCKVPEILILPPVY